MEPMDIETSSTTLPWWKKHKWLIIWITALILVVIVVIIIILTRHHDEPPSPPPPPAVYSYNCVDHTCAKIDGSGGTYDSHDACLASKCTVVPPPPPSPTIQSYNCVDHTCKPLYDSTGLYNTLDDCLHSDCTTVPTPPPPPPPPPVSTGKYVCKNFQCAEATDPDDPTAHYESMDECNQHCLPTKPPKIFADNPGGTETMKADVDKHCTKNTYWDLKPDTRNEYIDYLNQQHPYTFKPNPSAPKGQTQNKDRFFIVENKCPINVNMGYIGYNTSKHVATDPTTYNPFNVKYFNKKDDTMSVYDDESRVGFGGFNLRPGETALLQANDPIVSGRMWPRTACSYENISDGDYCYYDCAINAVNQSIGQGPPPPPPKENHCIYLTNKDGNKPVLSQDGQTYYSNIGGGCYFCPGDDIGPWPSPPENQAYCKYTHTDMITCSNDRDGVWPSKWTCTGQPSSDGSVPYPTLPTKDGFMNKEAYTDYCGGEGPPATPPEICTIPTAKKGLSGVCSNVSCAGGTNAYTGQVADELHKHVGVQFPEGTPPYCENVKLTCETGDVRLPCGANGVCAYAGCIANGYCDPFTYQPRGGLGPMGTTGLSPGLTIEYSLSAGDYSESPQSVAFGDFYDVSQVDGFSQMPISMAPIDGRFYPASDPNVPKEFNAKPSLCGKVCESSCPPELRSYGKDGKFNGCVSICHAVKEKEHRNGFKKRCKDVKSNPSNPEYAKRDEWPDCCLLDWYNQATVYWDPNCDASQRTASPNSPWCGSWMLPGTHPDYDGPKCGGVNPDETFKTKGCWKMTNLWDDGIKIPGTDNNDKTCGAKTHLDAKSHEWQDDTAINAAYADLLSHNTKDGKQQCKFLTDLICCDTGALSTVGGAGIQKTCLNPYVGDTGDDCKWQDGANVKNNYSQFGCSPYNEKYGLSQDRRDYYQRNICWLDDWPVPNQKWCDAQGFEGKDCSYAAPFKLNCPNAYSWQFDDLNSTYVASAADYYVTLCPDLEQVSTPPPPSVPKRCQPK